MGTFVAVVESFVGNDHYLHRGHHLRVFQGYRPVHSFRNEGHKGKGQKGDDSNPNL